MANEKGVWRTIGGRRVFIKEGQDLASAMKESGKFKSARKFSKREELKKDIAHQVTEAEKNGNTAHAEAGKRELERLNNEEKEQAVKDYENGKISAEDVLNKFYGQEDKMKEAFEKMGYTAPTKENIDKANKRHEEFMNNLKNEEDFQKWRKNNDANGEWTDEKAREIYENSKPVKYDIKTKSYEEVSKEDYKEKTWRDKIKDSNTRNEILDKELDESTKSKAKEFWSKEDSNGTDLNKFNDKAKAKFGKIDYNGTGRKVNEVEIEMELKDGVFSASGAIKNARGTDWLSGGQNIDEIADLMKGNKDVQEIRDLWHKYHLNDMHAGTEKQEEALEKFKGERKAIAEQMNKGKQYDWQKVDERDYEVTKKLLENHNLLKDNGYEYGTSWLKREIPDDDKKRIISLINKYNGKSSNTETSNKTTNQTMNETLRNAFNDYRKKHKNSNMSFTEFMRINKK